jgi:hypothetical protein
MTRAQTRRQRTQTGLDGCRLARAVTALSVSSFAITLLLWFIDGRARYFSVLSWGGAAPTANERVLLAWAACAATLALLLPGLAVAATASAFARPRFAFWSFVLWVGVAVAFLVIDLRTVEVFGRHLVELRHFAFMPGAADVAGGISPYLRTALVSLLLGSLAAGAALAFAQRALARVTRQSTLWAFAGAGSCMLVAGALAPRFMASLFVHTDLLESVCCTLPWDPRAVGSEHRIGDPGWAALESGLLRDYVRAFPSLFAKHPARHATANAQAVDHVVLIVLESLRADALSAERMPRLFAWSRQGFVAQQHYAGTNYSEAGMFALMYGRSPLLFHATLDRHEAPTFCQIGRELGMACQYFSGQPHPWLRMEEFLSERTLDRFAHDTAGDWNQWDRTALAAMVDSVTKPIPSRSLSIVYLMSTHFNYKYPTSYERHQPTIDFNFDKGMPTLGAEAKIPLINRYLNSLAFSDDIVADAIARLDPAHTLIILTGDHGELLGEGGRFGHGSGFSIPMTHVPFAMVGPGVPRSLRVEPSEHADVLPTTLHVLSGQPQASADGRDLFASLPRSGLLFAYCSPGRERAEALLVHGSLRLRLDLGLRRPDIGAMNLEDELGHRLTVPALDPKAVQTLLTAFEEEIETMRTSQPVAMP